MSGHTRPDVPTMLNMLEEAHQALITREAPPPDDAARLATVAADLRWYSERLGPARWEVEPRPERWSFAENLWHITEQASQAAREAAPPSARYFIDHGKEHVGQAAEIYALFEY